MKKSINSTYEKPVIIVHGNIMEVTKGAFTENSAEADKTDGPNKP